MFLRMLMVAWTIAALAVALSASELPPSDLAIEAVIDHYIRDDLAARQIVPAPRADDATVLRRTTLDLAGRIPTVTELEDFQAQSPSEKRERLVDRLLDSPDYALHLGNEWDALLIPEGKGSDNEWRAYLLQAARENRPWDQIFADILAAKEDDPARRGALQFLKVRARELDEMTNDTSVLFFGVNVGCAKCHDHPLVDAWKQDHFYGMTSFFARTYQTRSRRLAEKPFSEVKFKTTKGEEKTAALMFLTGAAASEPAIERTAEQKKADDEEIRRQQREENIPPPPAPSFSPRMELVQLALRPENRRFFARNGVNRIWARFFGRGLIHPLDQLHSANVASHPALLDWLERDFVEHGFDVQRLVRGIVLSEAYARSSQWLSQDPAPPTEAYAVAMVRPLSPKQLALSLHIAVANPQSFQSVLQSPQWAGVRTNLENQSAGWSSAFELPSEHFQISVTESLLFSNSDRVQNELLREGADRLLSVLKAHSDVDAGLQAAFRAIFSRPATADELATFRTYVAERTDRPVAAWQQVVWAMVTSPEFRFNY